MLLAFGFGGLASIDPIKPLRFTLESLAYGIVGTLPLCFVFQWSYGAHASGMLEIKRFLLEKLGPFLGACRALDLIYLGFLAGITEEILFRGFFQVWLETKWGWLGGLVFSNLIFALVHWVSPLYGLLAGLTGVYLGLAMDVGGERNLLTPILIHSLYDVVAFFAVAVSYRAAQGRK